MDQRVVLSCGPWWRWHSGRAQSRRSAASACFVRCIHNHKQSTLATGPILDSRFSWRSVNANECRSVPVHDCSKQLIAVITVCALRSRQSKSCFGCSKIVYAMLSSSFNETNSMATQIRHQNDEKVFCVPCFCSLSFCDFAW